MILNPQGCHIRIPGAAERGPAASGTPPPFFHRPGIRSSVFLAAALLLFLLIPPAGEARCAGLHRLPSRETAVPGRRADRQWAALPAGLARFHFPESLRPAVMPLYRELPAALDRVETVTGWRPKRPFRIILIPDRDRFRQLAGSAHFTAFARFPQRHIVIDCSRPPAEPSVRSAVLIHELTHILLHERIEEELLPRWLDEGMAQWAAGGISELDLPPRKDSLRTAAVSGRLPRLARISRDFPSTAGDLGLAYEMSRSMVRFLVRKENGAALRRMLAEMARGRDPHEAARSAFGRSLSDLEADWRASLRGWTGWLAWISLHLYEILFAGAALITAAGFIRHLIRRRGWRAEMALEEDEAAPRDGDIP